MKGSARVPETASGAEPHGDVIQRSRPRVVLGDPFRVVNADDGIGRRVLDAAVARPAIDGRGRCRAAGGTEGGGSDDAAPRGLHRGPHYQETQGP